MHDETFIPPQNIFLPTVDSDFIGDVITVTLPQPGGDSSGEVEVEIPLIDDEIYEELEQFLGYIEIVNAVDMGTIVLGRNITQLMITNDDSKQNMLTQWLCSTLHVLTTVIMVNIMVAYSLFCMMIVFDHASILRR